MPALKHGGVTQADIHGHGNDDWPEQTRKHTGFAAKVVREGAEVIIFFKVKGKYYPATDHNANVMDTYIHTGDKQLLNQFEDEVEL